jgi:hypothetical protein
MSARSRDHLTCIALLCFSTLAVGFVRTPPALQSRLTPAPPLQSCANPRHTRLRGGDCIPSEGALDALKDWHPVLLALLGTCFGWFMTALGAACVVIKRLGLPEELFRKVLDFFLGVSGGVMTAASYWSLLAVVC